MARFSLPILLVFGSLLLSAQTPKLEPPRPHPAVQTLVAWAESQEKGELPPEPAIFVPGDLKEFKEQMGPDGARFEEKLSETILGNRNNLTFRPHLEREDSGTVLSDKQPVFPMVLKKDQWFFDAVEARKMMTRVKISTTRVAIKSLLASLDQYKNIGGSYPSEKQGLKALFDRPKTDPHPRRWIQTIASLDALDDPWGHPLQYQLVEGKPVITSLGPDGKVSEDDISNR